MSRNRPTTLNNRLTEIISQLEPVAGQNHLKILEPNSGTINYSTPTKISKESR